jgi:pimeloyl-ACP methyl ester carboxylesterase
VLSDVAPPAWRRREVDAGGVRLAVVEAGTAVAGAPTLVLLHGLGHWSEAAWDRLVPRLDPRWRYAGVDLPGFGASEKPRARYDLAFFRRAIGAALDAIGGDSFAVCGHSLGGLLAADYAAAHPARVTRLALVAPAGFAHPLRHLAYALGAASAGPLVRRSPPPALVARILRRAVVDPGVLDPAVVARAIALSRDGGLRAAFTGVYAASLHGAIATRSFHAALAAYRGPVFCAWGAHDRYLRLSGLSIVRRIYPQARTLVLAHSAHLPMVEEPEPLAAALRSFFA